MSAVTFLQSYTLPHLRQLATLRSSCCSNTPPSPSSPFLAALELVRIRPPRLNMESDSSACCRAALMLPLVLAPCGEEGGVCGAG